MSWLIALYIYIVVWGAFFSISNFVLRIRGNGGHWFTLVLDLCWVGATIYACVVNGWISLPTLVVK